MFNQDTLLNTSDYFSKRNFPEFWQLNHWVLPYLLKKKM